MIRIKDLMVLNLDRKLLEIAGWAAMTFGTDIVTSAYRPGDSGVHGTIPLRGLDLRCRDIALGQLVSKRVNERWQYDPERPDMECCIAHGEGMNLHLHIQVHPRTQRRQ